MAKNAEGLTILHDEPLKTNAAINREHASTMSKAGMTPREIARAFPEVFRVSVEDGKEVLGQKYDSIHQQSQRKDTRFMITASAAKSALSAWKASPEGQAETKRRRARVPGRYQIVLTDPGDPWNYDKLTLHSAHDSEKAASKALKALPRELGSRAAVLDTVARPDIKVRASAERHEAGDNPSVVGKKDERVLRAFLLGEAAKGHKLTTDGSQLDGLWMGGRGIATRESYTGQIGGWDAHNMPVIVLHDLGGKTAQRIQAKLSRLAPGSQWFREGNTFSRRDGLRGSEKHAASASKHERGENPLTLAEKAKIKLGVLSPAAARAANSREKDLLREHAAEVQKLVENVDACRRCDHSAEKKAKKHLVKAKEALQGLEKLAKYRSDPDIAEASMKPLRKRVFEAEARLLGKNPGAIEIRSSLGASGSEDSGAPRSSRRPRHFTEAEVHESEHNPRVARKGPRRPSASKHERGENPLTKRQFDALTKKLGGTGRAGRSGLARDEIDAYRASRGRPMRGSGATVSTTRRDLLAERAAERARNPSAPLRGLASAPKRVGGSAFLRSWGEPIQRPFTGDSHGLSLMSREELKAYRGGAGKKDAALKARIDKLLGKK